MSNDGEMSVVQVNRGLVDIARNAQQSVDRSGI